MFTKFSTLVFACAIAIGCGGSGQMDHAIDLGGVGGNGNGGSGGSGGGGSGGSGGGGAGGTGGSGGAGGGVDMAAKSYVQSTIVKMRGGKSGDFELDNVVVVAAAPKGGKAYVQDAGGGDLSAIELECKAPACTVASTVATAMPGDQVTVKGTYIVETQAKGGGEVFYLDSIANNGKAPSAPAPAMVKYADVVKGVATRAKWFQKVTFTADDELDMFDFVPTEMAYAGATACPYQFGWGMVPKSTAPASSIPLATGQTCCATASTAVCTAGATAQTATDANEIIVGTDFYKTFTYSTDCRCAATFKDTVLTGAQIVPKASVLTGVLVYDGSTKTGTGYQYLAPLAKADLPIQ